MKDQLRSNSYLLENNEERLLLPNQQPVVHFEGKNIISGEVRKRPRKIFCGKVDPFRYLSGLVLFLVTASVVIILLFFRKEFNRLLVAYMEWVKDHAVLGVFAFVLVNVLLVPLLIPGTLLAILGSYVYGLLYGKLLGFLLVFALVVVSNTVGGYLAFLVARGLFHECLQPAFNRHRYLRAMNKGVSRNGFKIVALFRMCPVVPYNVFNYAAALTDVTHAQFFWGSLCGMAPMKGAEVLIFVDLSVDLASIIEGRYELGQGYRIMLIVGGVMAVGLIALIVCLTKKELDKEVAEVRRISLERQVQELNQGFAAHNEER